VGAFGPPPRDDVQVPPWAIGVGAARQLAERLGLHQGPRKAVNELLGAAVKNDANLSRKGPAILTALVQRRNGVAHVGAIAASARQQRFRACAATFLAWTADSGDDRAATVALTRGQQASRAFAAEMLAPRVYLQERANRYGFTADDIEEQASILICPYDTVLWQASRAGIPLRGVDLPTSHRPTFWQT